MVVITTSSDRHKCDRLRRSLAACGYELHIIDHEWRGFLDKLRYTYDYLKSCGHTHFIYTDAWDTVCLRADIPTPERFTISAERACYPHPEKATLYPYVDSPFMFVNGGGWGGPVSEFIRLYESKPPTDELNDQVWMTDIYLANTDSITLDTDCRIFQTLAFCEPTNFLGHLNTITVTYPYLWHGNGHTPLSLALDGMELTTATLAAKWADTKESHAEIDRDLAELCNGNPKLKALRDHVEAHVLGFGERSFLGLWDVLLSDLPKNPRLLEIGVFRGQTLAAWRMIDPKAIIRGITPLDSTDGHWESDYEKDIADLHKTFNLKQPTIWKGLSTDSAILEKAASADPFDLIYIDGGHSYEVAHSDVLRYSSFVKVGGLLVIDDCANRYDLPDGMFKGIEAVSMAVDEQLPNDYYIELFSVVHIRVFKRVK